MEFVWGQRGRMATQCEILHFSKWSFCKFSLVAGVYIAINLPRARRDVMLTISGSIVGKREGIDIITLHVVPEDHYVRERSYCDPVAFPKKTVLLFSWHSCMRSAPPV